MLTSLKSSSLPQRMASVSHWQAVGREKVSTDCPHVHLVPRRGLCIAQCVESTGAAGRRNVTFPLKNEFSLKQESLM